MAAEAEATDILLRLTMEGVEYFLRFTGAAAVKGVTFFAAAAKTVWEHERGKQKLGGKINPRAFIENFTASTIFPLSVEELNKLKPEMKRLHIPYMQYKSSREMKNSGQVEISVRREDAERFQRLAEKMGIGTVTPYDINTEEISQAAYDMLMADGDMPSVEAAVTPEGVTITENPTQAATDLSDPSPQSWEKSPVRSEPFRPKAGIENNLLAAKAEAARRDGRLIPLSINKDTLLSQTHYDTNGKLQGVTVIVPGTKQQQRLFIPKENIITMDADGGQTILADLLDRKYYRLSDSRTGQQRNISGAEIRDGKHWAKPERSGMERASAHHAAPQPKGR